MSNLTTGHPDWPYDDERQQPTECECGCGRELTDDAIEHGGRYLSDWCMNELQAIRDEYKEEETINSHWMTSYANKLLNPFGI